MAKKKKLKVGDLVRAYFLSTPDRCEVIEVTDKYLYKLRMSSGTILPGVTWYTLLNAKEKKTKPWYIDAYLGHKEVTKLTEDQNTSQNTTNSDDLKKAIKDQKNFVNGKIDR